VKVEGLSDGTTAELQLRKREDGLHIGFILRHGTCTAVRWAAFSVAYLGIQDLTSALNRRRVTIRLQKIEDGHYLVLVYKLVEYRVHLPAQVPTVLFAA